MGIFEDSSDEMIEGKENLSEVSPPGFSGTLRRLKKKKGITNPYALSWHMYNKGYKPHVKPEANPEGRKKYIPPDEYRRLKRESVMEATTTSSIPTVPWSSPPLYGLEFSEEEKDECVERVKRLFPGLTPKQLKDMIFGKEKGEGK